MVSILNCLNVDLRNENFSNYNRLIRKVKRLARGNAILLPTVRFPRLKFGDDCLQFVFGFESVAPIAAGWFGKVETVYVYTTKERKIVMKTYSKASEITVGVIGYGGAFNMGKAHLAQMQMAGMTPRAVAEIDPERLKVASDDFPGIEVYSSVDEMLAGSDVQLIAIITPHNTHAELAIKCLRAGRHVVCEKPLAITTEECDAMIAAAKEAGVVLSTYHNRHWDGCILRAVEQIRERKVIGEVIRIEAHMGGYGKPGDWWRTSKSISGGILYDWGVHLLEYALQLLDGEIVEVSGFAKKGFWGPQTKWQEDANEDEGFAVVRLSNGQWLNLTVTSIDAKGKDGQLEITGTKGAYVFDGGTWTLYSHGDGVKTVTTGRNPNSEGRKFYQNIADHLVEGEKLVITPEWSRRPIHILDLACKSAEINRAMKAKHA